MLLHGNDTAVPGFRWYDRARGRVVAASRPADAAEVEKELSDGHGLLAYDGASVSNLFSGDAPTRLLTVSHAKLPGSDRGSASFASLRFGLLRSVALFIGQLVLEWYQARRQRIRDVVPRVDRGGAFLLLRGLTTVVLRDLNVAVVAEQLTRGAPVVYVDFVDYDEVAHHAGPSRPESMRTLENMDRVLGVLEQLAHEVGRRYEIVVVSDHGQAQGSTYLQLTGRTLRDTVAELATSATAAPAPVEPEEEPHGETWVPAQLLLSALTGPARLVVRAARALAGRADKPAPSRRRSPRWSSRCPAAWPTSTAPTSPSGPPASGSTSCTRGWCAGWRPTRTSAWC